MKKKFLITAIVVMFAMILSGCCNNTEEQHSLGKTYVKPYNVEKLIIQLDDYSNYYIWSMEFNYQEHQYVLFYSNHPVIIHHPDCDCYNKKKDVGSYLDW